MAKKEFSFEDFCRNEDKTIANRQREIAKTHARCLVDKAVSGRLKGFLGSLLPLVGAGVVKDGQELSGKFVGSDFVFPATTFFGTVECVLNRSEWEEYV